MPDEQSLVVRVDNNNPEYQAAVKALLDVKGRTYFYHEDEGDLLKGLEDAAKKVGVEDCWKMFNIYSEACQDFLRNGHGKYEHLIVNYAYIRGENGKRVPFEKDS